VKIERILVIKLKHIGDVLLATPAIHALRKGFPKSRIYALVYAGTDEMLTGNPDLDEVLIFDKRWGVGRLMGEGRLVADASVLVSDLSVYLGSEIDPEGEYDSVGGMLTERLGRVPPVGTAVPSVGTRS
jgi:hypothetical protein